MKTREVAGVVVFAGYLVTGCLVTGCSPSRGPERGAIAARRDSGISTAALALDAGVGAEVVEASDAAADAGEPVAEQQTSLSIADCWELGGRAFGVVGHFPDTIDDPHIDLAAGEPCPSGATSLGEVVSADDPNGGVCCERPPSLSPAECDSLGGKIWGDPGGGSTYREGCPYGEKLLGWLDICDAPPGGFCGEGGICCAQ